MFFATFCISHAKLHRGDNKEPLDMTKITRRQFVASTAATTACRAAEGSRSPITALVCQPTTCTEGFALLLANADRIQDIGTGWRPIVATALGKMTAIDPQLEIRQIKQKLGGLKIYYRSQHYEQLQPAVIEAQGLCGSACEKCGGPASLFNENGWIRTLCDRHRPS